MCLRDQLGHIEGLLAIRIGTRTSGNPAAIGIELGLWDRPD
jgi:hypothetical protein